jgi:hypothetical protein
METLENKMNSKIKEVWVNALRSGEYNQGGEKLRGANGYCCLGVLCDIYVKEHNKEWEFVSVDEYSDENNPYPMDYWYFDGESEFLPESVREWAELNLRNPILRVEDEEDEFVDEVANINDSGYSFSTIADLIEAQL